jgi:hypothetical protein
MMLTEVNNNDQCGWSVPAVTITRFFFAQAAQKPGTAHSPLGSNLSCLARLSLVTKDTIFECKKNLSSFRSACFPDAAMCQPALVLPGNLVFAHQRIQAGSGNP